MQLHIPEDTGPVARVVWGTGSGTYRNKHEGCYILYTGWALPGAQGGGGWVRACNPVTISYLSSYPTYLAPTPYLVFARRVFQNLVTPPLAAGRVLDAHHPLP